MKAIVIATTNNRTEWVKNCLDSLKDYTRYPIIVLNQYDYELGKIKWVFDNTNLDEFILLQDSVEIKDTSILDMAFDHRGSVYFATLPFYMYLGKYTRKTLEKVLIPQPTSKLQAVEQERDWTKLYLDADDNPIRIGDLDDTNTYADFLGRRNMILENQYIKKYKHIWDMSMVYDY